MLIENINFLYIYKIILSIIISIFIIFLIIIIQENVYAENNDFDIEIPFYYLHNYQNLDNYHLNNYHLENNNIIPNQFIVYLQEDTKAEEKEEKSNSIDPLKFYNS